MRIWELGLFLRCPALGCGPDSECLWPRCCAVCGVFPSHASKLFPAEQGPAVQRVVCCQGPVTPKEYRGLRRGELGGLPFPGSFSLAAWSRGGDTILPLLATVVAEATPFKIKETKGTKHS